MSIIYINYFYYKLKLININFFIYKIFIYDILVNINETVDETIHENSQSNEETNTKTKTIVKIDRDGKSSEWNGEHTVFHDVEEESGKRKNKFYNLRYL